ncbi:MAG: zinc-binding dehydrogenase [Anaerolineae bacterium]|nr:zinc-binding dehydrogenase [Anaerolineae bacterium]
MKTVIIYGALDVRVKEVEIPKIGPHDVLVRVRASGICGSDVHRYLATAFGLTWKYPMNSGHEYCGDVAEVGSEVRRFRVGDKATLGVAWPQGNLGAFSEYVFIPDADRRLVKVPQHVSYEDGAVIEPFTVALKSCYRPMLKPQDSILILGAGAIGLSVLLLCRARGIENVTVSEISDKRRQLAAKIGAQTINPAAENLEEIVKSATKGKGADVTFECAGAEATLKQAFALTSRGGRIGLIAHYRKVPPFDFEGFMSGSRSLYRPMDATPFYAEAVQLVAEGKVDLAQLVSHKFPLEQAQEAFEVAIKPNESVKVLFTP